MMARKRAKSVKVEREMLEAMAREHLATFVYLAFRILHPGQRLIPSWHIDMMCWHLQKMAEGLEPPRCIFNLPPRSLKSFVISICLPAWLLGRNPSCKIVCISYSEELAKKLSRDCRALMQSDFYRRIFPGTRLSAQKSTEIEFETTERGYRFATSVGGTLTGRGGEWLILDDPMKAEEATSERMRTSVAEWFKHSARSRLDDQRQDKIVVTMQRLHPEDLSGLLIKAGWPCIAVPAIETDARRYEIGPDRFHDVKAADILQADRIDRTTLDQIKADIGRHAFSAEYQQDPLPEDGDYIRREYFRRVDGPDANGYRCVVISVDPAAKKGPNNDFTAITTYSVSCETFHLLHAVKGRWNVTETVAQITMLVERYRAREIIVESTSSGTAVLEMLEERRIGVESYDPHPTEDKVTRLLRQLAKIESGKVTLPTEAPWIDEFLEEVVNFPNARFDDYVDTLIQLLEWRDREGYLHFVPMVSAPISIRGDD